MYSQAVNINESGGAENRIVSACPRCAHARNNRLTAYACAVALRIPIISCAQVVHCAAVNEIT